MRTQVRKNLNKVIRLVLLVMMLFSLTACGGEKNEVLNPNEDNVLAIQVPGGFDIDDKSDVMFAVILGAPSGMGEPARVVVDQLAEEYGANYSFCLIPLRDSINIRIESVTAGDMAFNDFPPYAETDEFTASLGAYYLVNSFMEEESDLYLYTRIVAQDGYEQGVFLVDPVNHGESGEFIISPSKIPAGLNDSKMRLISGMAANAVWQYGVELGWVDEWGQSDQPITPEQLALSQLSYTESIYSILSMFGYRQSDEPHYSEKTKQYAAALFPGVKINQLPETDEITARGDQLFTWGNTTQILLSAASADGKTGYVMVNISDEVYRVDWEADEPFDVYRPFQYQLIGVQPMQRFVMGGQPYENFVDKYLTPESTTALEELGITYVPGYLDNMGVWGAGNTWLLRDLGAEANGWTETYILLDDDGDRITYLGAYSPADYETETIKEVEDGWTDLGIICIPSSWNYETHILDDIVIYGEGSSAPFNMWAGWLMADSVESAVESSTTYEQFLFDDGHIGYMLFFDTYISWQREDWMSLQLQHDGNELIYENNKDLILKIARSLTVK